MPTVGLDCMVILDGNGYMIEPDTYVMQRPRMRSATLNRALGGINGAGERYVDHGPGKRIWTFTVLAYQAMRDYAGNFVSPTGQNCHDTLHTSYQKVATLLSFTDPLATVWNVHFDHLSEQIINVRAQADGQAQYIMHVTLIEG